MAGRKRRQGVRRYKNGAITNADRGETGDEVLSTVKAQRAKRGVPVEYLRDQLAVDLLGEFRILGVEYEKNGEKSKSPHGLDRDQYESGRWYSGLVAFCRRTDDTPSQNPKSIDMTRFALWNDKIEDADKLDAVRIWLPDDEPTPEYIASRKAERKICEDVLIEAGRSEGEPYSIIAAVNAVCVDNRIPPGEHRMTVLPRLRFGLNLITQVRLRMKTARCA